MPFTIQVVQTWQMLESDAFGAGGRTITHRVGSIKLTGADRHNAQAQQVSADVSALELSIVPLGISATGAVLFLSTDNPIDLRIGTASATIISAVQQLVMGANVSNLYITTGSQATKVVLEVAGGSGATIKSSIPMP